MDIDIIHHKIEELLNSKSPLEDCVINNIPSSIDEGLMYIKEIDNELVQLEILVECEHETADSDPRHKLYPVREHISNKLKEYLGIRNTRDK